ncbi:AAA family ATPase [Amnibacterium kyonggiense]|uniref:MoxR-like ATPase n=1 Tax=Amnibacterium kyonggiense TaxID=595671 RepID=A0A4R7FQY3_9MICO|nr:MoxR family ATPase [Amnibacterium kyonggiense]TDS80215.1 MoxR-like ATPase [Amnibacterium kyonggiense]
MTDGITLDSRGAEAVRDAADRVIAAVGTVIDGKDDVIRSAFAVMLAGGHLLIEDVPGVGKTMLAKALARATGGTISRIQFTPDLLPSDVTGASVFDQSAARFEFKPGAVFANVVIGDEINRASPKTQAALLECMEEGQVTVDGSSWPLPDPFLVVATQNPVDMEGTYVLPEAQRDRFMARISMGYPDEDAEREMLRSHGRVDPIERLESVLPAGGLADLAAQARDVYVSPAVETYVLRIVGATRNHSEVRLGASPRASLQLLRAAKATALIDGRDFVLPDDVDALAADVLAHRLVLRRTGVDVREGQAVAATRIVRQVVAATPVPLQ